MNLRVKLTSRRLLAILMVAAVVSSLFGGDLPRRIRPWVQTALIPFGDAGMYLTTEFRSRLSDGEGGEISPEDVRKLRKENEHLINYIADLERMAGVQQRQLRDVANFRGTYGEGGRFPWELISARVVMMDSLPYGETRVINVGRTRGVREGLKVTERVVLTDRTKAILPDGLPVVTGAALVGRVIESSAHTARLRLVIDREFRIKGQILRDPSNQREITIIPMGIRQPLTLENNQPVDDIGECTGDGVGHVIVGNVKEDHNVLPGDLLVTRDDDYYLPARVRIGKVVEVRRYPNSPGFVTLRVRPSADLDSLRDVYIVVPPGGR